MKFPLPFVLLSLAACGVEQSKPAPVADPDAWGQLESSGRPLQADNVPAASQARKRRA